MICLGKGSAGSLLGSCLLLRNLAELVSQLVWVLQPPKFIYGDQGGSPLWMQTGSRPLRSCFSVTWGSQRDSEELRLSPGMTPCSTSCKHDGPSARGLWGGGRPQPRRDPCPPPGTGTVRGWDSGGPGGGGWGRPACGRRVEHTLPGGSPVPSFMGFECEVWFLNVGDKFRPRGPASTRQTTCGHPSESPRAGKARPRRVVVGERREWGVSTPGQRPPHVLGSRRLAAITVPFPGSPCRGPD